MADRVERLREAAQARHEVTLRRAESVLQRMAKRGDPVTFNGVAETARVSRSWLCRQPTLREEIDRLRDAATTRPGVLPSACEPPATRSASESTPTEKRSPGCAARPGTARAARPAPRRRPSVHRHTTLTTAVEDMSTTRNMLPHKRYRLTDQENAS